MEGRSQVLVERPRSRSRLVRRTQWICAAEKESRNFPIFLKNFWNLWKAAVFYPSAWRTSGKTLQIEIITDTTSQKNVDTLVAALQCSSEASRTWLQPSNAIRTSPGQPRHQRSSIEGVVPSPESVHIFPASGDRSSVIYSSEFFTWRTRSTCLHGLPLAHRRVQPQPCVSRRMHSVQLMTSPWARNPSDAELEKGPTGPPDSRTRFP